ncbi:MAG: AraC family transcriptional regulator [Bacteroidetes bacterium]|nr:AraC family transcriptional regulator [Bacteroidota bacterium]
MNFGPITHNTPKLEPFIQGFAFAMADQRTQDDSIILPPLGFPSLLLECSPDTKYAENSIRSNNCLLIGTHTHQIAIPGLHLNYLRIDFKPYGLYNLLLLEMRTFVNQVIDAKIVFGAEEMESLISDLVSLKTRTSKARRVEHFFLEIASNRQTTNHPIYDEVADKILSSNGLSRDVHTFGHPGSLRSLERYFKNHIGLTIKTFQGVIRHKYIIAKMAENPSFKWNDPALDGIFYDQSHFDRDFKKFEGIKPSKYKSSISIF